MRNNSNARIQKQIITLALFIGLAVIAVRFVLSNRPPFTTLPSPTSTYEILIPVTNMTRTTQPDYAINAAALGDYPVDDLTGASMNFEYPVFLLPNSSDVVTLTIRRLTTLQGIPVTSYLGTFQRALVPIDQPLEIGEYFNFRSFILIVPEMRASLSSAGITVIPQFSNSKKEIGLTSEAFWAWIIEASSNVANHPLFLNLYLGENQEPIWSYSFRVVVTFPTDTPLPSATSSPLPTATLTPTPTKTTEQQLKEVFISKAPETLSSVLSLGGVILTAFVGLAGIMVGALLQRRVEFLKPKESEKAVISKSAQEKKSKDNSKAKPS